MIFVWRERVNWISFHLSENEIEPDKHYFNSKIMYECETISIKSLSEIVFRLWDFFNVEIVWSMPDFYVVELLNR